MIAGDLAPDTGTILVPRLTRIGQVEQEAPGGPGALIDFVLAADKERAALLEEAETAADPGRIADIQLRLADISAHSAPARAAEILAGLGFDHEAQQRALSEFSGGWRMRVALAAVLFSAPDLLLLDEPTNYLDLEGTLWLIDYLTTYPATVLVISHDRDLLDAVSNHILHLDASQADALPRQLHGLREAAARAAGDPAQARQKAGGERQHLQAFVDRFRAKATKARQAQSRLKMLAKMEPVAAIVDSEVLPFRFPSPAKPLRPPIVVMDGASAGYGDTTVLQRLNLSIAEDDRIALLGSNGNGKSTFAKLIAGRLEPMTGVVRRSSKLDVGFFAQHQIDDLDPKGTPVSHVAPLMPGAGQAQVRSRTAQMGFPANKAETRVSELSGGEKARLLMGLATFAGPHLLILDEPTNHLDIDSRAALMEAINEYEGAVILVSHDRYLVEACADRLWVVANRTVTSFDGDMDEYRRAVLDGGTPTGARERRQEPSAVADGEKRSARGRKEVAPRRRKLGSIEERISRFQGLLARVDGALASPDAYKRDPASAQKLAQQRAELERALVSAEEEWLALSEEMEQEKAGA